MDYQTLSVSIDPSNTGSDTGKSIKRRFDPILSNKAKI
jgi:hypothetical protein